MNDTLLNLDLKYVRLEYDYVLNRNHEIFDRKKMPIVPFFSVWFRLEQTRKLGSSFTLCFHSDCSSERQRIDWRNNIAELCHRHTPYVYSTC